VVNVFTMIEYNIIRECVNVVTMIEYTIIRKCDMGGECGYND